MARAPSWPGRSTPADRSDLDLAVANFAADTVSILLGTGATAATFGTKTDFGAGNGPRAVATGLFNAGTDPDLAVANELSGNVSVLLGSTGGTFTGPTDNAAGGSPSGVAVGDFNLDGDPDLAVANLSSDDVSILVGGSGGTFGAATAIAAGDGPRSIAVGDFNGDGDPDLAVPNENSDDVSILLGAAGAGFETAVGVTAGNAPRSVAVADFTLDGDLDLAVANSQSDNVSVLRGGAGGSFAAPVDFAAGNEPFAVAAGDLDDDGEQDLVVANITSDDISVLLNETPPNTTIDGGPSGLSNDTTPTFTFSADEPGVTFECRVDAESAVDCVSPFTTAALPDGSHTFEVRATDVAGNIEPAQASRVVEIDATAPDTAVDSGPSGLSSQPSPAFAFSSSEPGSAFECRVDAAAFAACAAPFAAGVLADGAHTFEVRATDPAGNTDVTPAARAFTIDTVAPETSITAGPSGRTTDLNPTFAFAAEAGATFECRVDAAAFAACSTPFTAAPLSRGPHAFEVRASDAAGNRDATPARRTFTALLRIRSLVTNAWRFGSVHDRRGVGRQGGAPRRASTRSLPWRGVPVRPPEGCARSPAACEPHAAVPRCAAAARDGRRGSRDRSPRHREGRPVPHPPQRATAFPNALPAAGKLPAGEVLRPVPESRRGRQSG